MNNKCFFCQGAAFGRDTLEIGPQCYGGKDQNCDVKGILQKQVLGAIVGKTKIVMSKKGKQKTYILLFQRYKILCFLQLEQLKQHREIWYYRHGDAQISQCNPIAGKSVMTVNREIMFVNKNSMQTNLCDVECRQLTRRGKEIKLTIGEKF